jgi:hypothetical protein
MQSAKYCWVGGDLFYTGADLIIRRCVREDEMFDILKAYHDEPCSGHFSEKRTDYKILQLGYYWPSIFKDTKQYVRSCDSCQRTGRPTAANEMPLQPQVVIEPFEKWALDFVGPINPPSKRKRYVWVCTDYVTKWGEVKALPHATEQSLINFIFKDILLDLEYLEKIVINQGAQFTSKLVQSILQEYKIRHRKSTPYHPQANGQVQSTNKILEGILTKTIQLHQSDRAEKLPESLWAYRTTWKNVTGHTPYVLVYGKKVLLPIQFEIKTFKIASELGLSLSEAQQQRVLQLNELDEVPQDTLQKTTLVQEQRLDGMINSLRKSSSKSVIGPSFFIQNLKFSKASLPPTG